MFKSLKLCQISSKIITQISSQQMRCGITPICIQTRSMRRFIREPVKVLTEDGEDYDTHWASKQRVSAINDELSRDMMKKLNPSSDQYYDEAIYDHNNELNYSRKKAKTSKQRKDFDDKTVSNKERFMGINDDNNEFNYSRKKAKTFRQTKDFDDNIVSNKERFMGINDDNNEFNYSRKKAKTFRQTKDFDDNNVSNKENVKGKQFSQTKQKQNDIPKTNKKRFDKPKVDSTTTKELRPKIEGIPVYEKLGDDNREFFKVINAIKMRKQREKNNQMILEGIRIINDAIDANIAIETIYFSKEENLVGIKRLTDLIKSGVGLKKVFYKDIKLFSDTVTNPGVMAVCNKPDNQQIIDAHIYTEELKLPLIVVCDNIRDPGNMGTLIRSCAAFGVERIVATKGCVDTWEPKVMRSGAGAHFRIPIVNNVEWPQLIEQLSNENLGHIFLAESNPTELNSSSNNQSLTSEDARELKKYMTHTPLVSLMYNEESFFSNILNKKSVLVIGGETQGLSVESYKFAHQFDGRRIKIPLSFGMDSLNSTTAATIIIFEMKRQYLIRYSGQSNQHVLLV